MVRMYAIQVARQLELPLKRWGGKRRGAGRPRKDGLQGPGVSHVVRPVLAHRFPVHVTWKVESWSLRSRRGFSALSRAMWKASDRFGFRLVHYSVMSNHMHLIVEANDRRALGRGMKGLGVRIAKSLNRVMGRHGKVLLDRYHAHILRTPTETRRARHYLLDNAHHHYHSIGPDPYSSREPLIRPRTWLLRRLE